MLYSKRLSRKFKYIGMLGEAFGGNFFRLDYRMTWITWSVILLVNIAMGFTLHTMYFKAAIEKSLGETLKCFCMFGTGVQGYVKLINIIRNDKEYRALGDAMLKTFQTNERKHEHYRICLKETLKFQNKLFVVIFISCTLTVAGLVGVPLYYMKFHNERLFIMPFFIPFVNPYTNFGYFSNLALHIMCVVAGCYGNFVYDCWCFLTVAHIPLLKNILHCKFEDLDEILESKEHREENTKIVLRDIFENHQQYILFSNSAKTGFFWIVLTLVFFAFTGIVCTMVCLFLKTWPAAPVYLIYSFVNLYIFCGLGNLIENANDDVTVIIYNSLWYLLPVPEQKMILIMLRESQKAVGMTVGGIMPLSLSTAQDITKHMYSVAMMLNQFLD